MQGVLMSMEAEVEQKLVTLRRVAACYDVDTPDVRGLNVKEKRVGSSSYY